MFKHQLPLIFKHQLPLTTLPQPLFEAAQHKLIGIGDAYDAALSESRKPDPLVSARQAEISAELRAVDSKLREINTNSAAVEEQIYQLLQRALFELQDATQARRVEKSRIPTIHIVKISPQQNAQAKP